VHGLLSQPSVLRKVTLRSTSGDALRARQSLERALSSVHWTPSGLPPQAVLLVRRMAVMPRSTDGPAHPNEFAQQVSQALQSCAASARRPWLQDDAASSEAVLFLDQAELAACLVGDALSGRVTAHWWWRAVLSGRTPQEWLRNEVLASGRLMAPTVSLLAGRSQAVLWAVQWTEAEAQTGLVALGQTHGWVPRADLNLDVNDSGSTSSKVYGLAREVTTHSSQADVTRILAIAPELRHATALHTPAAQLLAASLLLARDPSWLRTERGTAACAAWIALRQHELPMALHTARAVPRCHSVDASTALRQEVNSATSEGVAVPPTDAPTPLLSQSANSHVSVEETWVPSPTSPKRPTIAASPASEPGVRNSGPALEALKTQSALQTNPRARCQLAAAKLPISTVEAVHAQSNLQQASPSTTAQPTRHQSEQASFGLMLQSEYGGIFYLLNIALALELYGDFTRPRAPGLALSPWDLLAWTGRTWFGSAFERDPQWPLLAELAGRKPNRMPGRDFVPLSPTGVAGDWVINPAWLEPWGPRADLRWRRTSRREHAWHPAGFVVRDVAIGAEPPSRSRRAIWLRRLLGYVQARTALALGAEDAAQVPRLLCRHAAEVQVSATALDVTLSLDALPLSVRLAGLDRNPGWIPAAGRSIYFHFR
jgi:hypothetical protein